MSGSWWGVDPGTANMGAVLVDDRGPVVIIDIVSRPATKGKAATKNRTAVAGQPKRLETTVWLRDGEALGLAWIKELPAESYDALDAFRRAILPLGARGDAGAAVERIMGNVSPDLADTGGAVVGLLWARGIERPVRPSASAWRRRMLDIPGNTPRAVAERVAVARVREEVPGWPVEASGHAAEAYWIARWGAECAG